MRSDMWKVIVERPRLGRRRADAIGRRASKLLPHDHEGEHLDVIERSPRTKSLNENLAPLQRYLERQVGRPWNKVYSEMRAEISFDNVVQKHVLAHLRQLIELRPQIVDGVVYREDGWPLTLRRRASALYVDPDSGIIKKPRVRRAGMNTLNARRDDFASLGPCACLLRIEGAWFHITLAPTPRSLDLTRARDVVTQRAPDYAWWSPHGAWHRYGAPNVYAVAKRQLSKRELRAHRRAGRIR